jgi:hypothetical protein
MPDGPEIRPGVLSHFINTISMSNSQNVGQTPKVKFALLAFFVLLYNYFFWEEQFGINLLLFSGLLLPAALFTHAGGRPRGNAWVAIGFTLLSGLMVVWHNSFVSKLAHLVSCFVTVGFLHEPRFRSVLYAAWYAGRTTWETGLQGLPLLGRGVTGLLPRVAVLKLAPRWLKLLTVPGAFFSVFFVIFSIANPVFADLGARLGTLLGEALELLFGGFSFVRLLFILPGVYLVAVVLYKWDIAEVYGQESRETNVIVRHRRKLGRLAGMIALKSERQAALLLVISVNALLVVVNVIDVRWLWFNFDPRQAGNLTKLVHEGTYMLILSILLSMGILIYYFRSNQNFYPKNGLLKAAAYLWLVQNAVLSVSVLIRCGHYISEYGLAYKRIGVIIFLGLVFFGLFTLYRKIRGQKSFYYLLRTNAWAAYAMLIGLSLVNWDVLIVEYNLDPKHVHSGIIDTGFLLNRSDKTLPLLDAHRERLQASSGNTGYNGSNAGHLDNRIAGFLDTYESRTWLSWNYADHRTYQYFKRK